MVIRLLVTIITVALLLGCTPCRQCRRENPRESFSLEQLLKTPAQTVIHGRTYSLNSYIYRDFMPTVGVKRERGVNIILYITPHSPAPLTDTLYFHECWLIQGEQLHHIAGTATDTPLKWGLKGRSPYYEVTLPDGPLWEAGSSLTLVVHLKDAQGNSYWLKAVEQYIMRVS